MTLAFTERSPGVSDSVLRAIDVTKKILPKHYLAIVVDVISHDGDGLYVACFVAFASTVRILARFCLCL